jgi:hypothetical protein
VRAGRSGWIRGSRKFVDGLLPEDWDRSRLSHYLTGVERVVELESQWTARQREEMGMTVRFPSRA